MRSGPLRHRITLLRPVITEDAYGQQIKSYVAAGDVSAEDASPNLTNMAYAKEVIAGGAEVSLSIRQITIRFHREITEDWRVRPRTGRYAGRDMEIKAIREGNKPTILVLFAQVLNG